MYTEPVPLKYGKLAAKYPWIYEYFYSVGDALGMGDGRLATVVEESGREERMSIADNRAALNCSCNTLFSF